MYIIHNNHYNFLHCCSNNPNRVYFDLIFEGDQLNPMYQQRFFNIIRQELPLIRYQNYLGYVIGQFLIYAEDYTDFTKVPLTFRVLNLTWTPELNNRFSAVYQGHARLFCADVRVEFLLYYICNVDG